MAKTQGMGTKLTGYSVRAWLENADIDRLKNLSEKSGIKGVELSSRILSAGIRAVVADGFKITFPLEFEISEPCKPDAPPPPSRLELNEPKPRKK